MALWTFGAFLLAISICCCCSQANDLKNRIFESASKSADKYAFVKRVSASGLSDSTICMWHNLITSKPVINHIFSYAVAGNDNEIITFLTGTTYSSYIGRKYASTTLQQEQIESLLGWKRFCWVIKREGDRYSVKWYVGDHDEFKLFVSQTVPYNQPIKSNGAVVLFQDQDSFLGGFQAHQAGLGRITWFNWWNSAMSHSDLNELSCDNDGNAVDMTMFETVGDLVVNEKSPCLENYCSKLKDDIKKSLQKIQGDLSVVIEGLSDD